MGERASAGQRDFSEETLVASRAAAAVQGRGTEVRQSRSCRAGVGPFNRLAFKTEVGGRLQQLVGKAGWWRECFTKLTASRFAKGFFDSQSGAHSWQAWLWQSWRRQSKLRLSLAEIVTSQMTF